MFCLLTRVLSFSSIRLKIHPYFSVTLRKITQLPSLKKNIIALFVEQSSENVVQVYFRHQFLVIGKIAVVLWQLQNVESVVLYQQCNVRLLFCHKNVLFCNSLQMYLFMRYFHGTLTQL